jgi:hypothetical protein
MATLASVRWWPQVGSRPPSGAVAGSATGGIIGALTQAGVGKEDADVYAEGLRRGGAVVSARVADAERPACKASWIARPSEAPTGARPTAGPDGSPSTRARRPTRRSRCAGSVSSIDNTTA